MAEGNPIREELDALIRQFNTNWHACGNAEDAGNYPMLNELNARHRRLITRLAHYGLTFNDLGYDKETSTFSLPTGILALASQ